MSDSDFDLMIHTQFWIEWAPDLRELARRVAAKAEEFSAQGLKVISVSHALEPDAPVDERWSAYVVAESRQPQPV